jgi:hypothetical protein
MHLRSRPLGIAALAAGLWLSSADAAVAQRWPTEPVTFAGGRLLIGGDASATFGSEDPGWFTYTDYERAIRRLRAGVTEARQRPCHSWRRYGPKRVGITPTRGTRISPPRAACSTSGGRIRRCSGRSRTSYPRQPAHQTAADLSMPDPCARMRSRDGRRPAQMRGGCRECLSRARTAQRRVHVAAERWDTRRWIGPRAGEPPRMLVAPEGRVSDDNNGGISRAAWPGIRRSRSAVGGEGLADNVNERADARRDMTQRASGIDANPRAAG